VTKQHEPSTDDSRAFICMGMIIMALPVILTIVGILVAKVHAAVLVLALVLLIGSACSGSRT
jgi:hypothetical protein